MERRRYLATVGAVGAVAVGGPSVAGCLGSAAEFDVGMTASAFDPEIVTVAPGETVVWHNTSTRAHTVTALGETLPEGADYFATGGYDDLAAAESAFWAERGGALDNGERFSHGFDVPGVYDYVCIPHAEAGMYGQVRVEA